MGKKLNPRHGSMQFWPRKRATRSYAKVRSVPLCNEARPLDFAGYKVGMTHVVAIDNGKTSITKGEKVAMPVTVIECPPLKISSIRFYKTSGYGTAVAKELFFKTDKELLRTIKMSSTLAKVEDLDNVDLTDVKDVKAVVYTQPSMTGFGKKAPEVFEVHIGGSNEQKVAFIKEHLETGIAISDAFKAGSYVDVRGVTKGKGVQGPVKRFGIQLRAKKSEKTKRGPGSLGSWKGQGHMMYRIAFAGQMGFHQRTQYNSYILSVSSDIEKVNPDGGFIRYGNVKSTYVLIKGSVQGAKKRLVHMTIPMRPTAKTTLPTIVSVSTESKQGN